MRRRFATFAFMLASCTVVAACGSAQDTTKSADKAAGEGSVDPVQMETDGNTAVERIDVNDDQKPDVFKYFRLVETAAAESPATPEGQAANVRAKRKVLVRKELDVNFDQRIDIVEYYKGEASKEIKVKEEMDLDFDGKVDSTYHYTDGNVTLIEQDLGFDGKTDTWKYYQLTTGEDGKAINRLIERRRDTSNDGKVDVWEFFTKGALAKVGTDTNGDGTPDQFTRVDDKR